MLKRYSIQFWLLNLSTLLFFFSFNVLIPELPQYLTNLGGEDYKGFIIGLFTITAALSRPVSGKLTDKIGRLPVMIFGGVVCIIASFLYPMLSTVSAFLFLRFMHGLSTGFMPTGTVAYLADIIPDDRRGEAMGIVGIMNNVGFMAGNAFSSIITNNTGINNLFYVSGILAFLSVAVIVNMKETLKDKQRFKIKMLKIKKEDVFDPRALYPSVVMILTTVSFGSMLTLIPDYSVSLGIMNKGLFLTITTVATIAVRFYAGKLSDRIGRLRTCLYGTFFWIIATILLSTLNIYCFYAAAVSVGIATGMNSPALFAWAVDVANGVKSGRAMATLFLSMEIGISTGAFLSAAIYGNVFNNLRTVFIVLTIINILALLFLMVKNKAERLVNTSSEHQY